MDTNWNYTLTLLESFNEEQRTIELLKMKTSQKDRQCTHIHVWILRQDVVSHKLARKQDFWLVEHADSEIDRHEEFVAADSYMWNLNSESSLRILFSLSLYQAENNWLFFNLWNGHRVGWSV